MSDQPTQEDTGFDISEFDPLASPTSKPEPAVEEKVTSTAATEEEKPVDMVAALLEQAEQHDAEEKAQYEQRIAEEEKQLGLTL